MGVACRDAALAKFGQHSGWVDTQGSTDTSQRPPDLVQMYGVVDLFWQQTPAAHRHVVPMQDLTDRPPLDTKPGPQLIHRVSALVPGDEFLDLIGTKLARPARFGSVGGRRNGCGGVGKLPVQGFQGFYLRFQVVISSPKVHKSARKKLLIRGFVACRA